MTERFVFLSQILVFFFFIHIYLIIPFFNFLEVQTLGLDYLEKEKTARVRLKEAIKDVEIEYKVFNSVGCENKLNQSSFNEKTELLCDTQRNIFSTPKFGMWVVKARIYKIINGVRRLLETIVIATVL